MIRYRKASWNDLEQILDLIDTGFSTQNKSVIDKKEGEEHRILFSYLYSRQDWDPCRLFLAESDGRIIAAVGLFPQTLSFEGVAIPIWAISPVVTHPEHRGLGIAGKCLSICLEAIKNQGISAVFLWGLPDYYPKLGFVPILPRYKTKISLGRIAYSELKTPGEFRGLNKEDLVQISNIYNKLDSGEYWLNPARGLSWWQNRIEEMDIEHANLKEVPFSKKDNFIVWENYLGEITGYLYFKEDPEQKKMIIDEGSADSSETAIAMVNAFISRFIKQNVTLYIRGTPAHPLNVAAYRMGGLNLIPAPLAGMIKVIDWPNFLQQLQPLFNKRLSQKTLSQKNFYWQFNNEHLSMKLNGSSSKGVELEVVKLTAFESSKGNTEFTRLVFGLYDRIDMNNILSSSINDESFKLLQTCFPLKYPFIWDANYLY